MIFCWFPCMASWNKNYKKAHLEKPSHKQRTNTHTHTHKRVHMLSHRSNAYSHTNIVIVQLSRVARRRCQSCSIHFHAACYSSSFLMHLLQVYCFSRRLCRTTNTSLSLKMSKVGWKSQIIWKSIFIVVRNFPKNLLGYCIFVVLYIALHFLWFCPCFFRYALSLLFRLFRTCKQGRANVQAIFVFFRFFFFAFQKSYMKMALSDSGENRRLRPAVAACCLLIALSLLSDALLLPVLAQRADNVS